MIKEYETTVSKLFIMTKTRKTNFWRVSVKFHLWVPLIAIRPSDGNVKPGGHLCAFREEQAMSRHRVSPSPFLSSSSHTTRLHYTYSQPNLNFIQYTIQVLVPHLMSSAQALREIKIVHIQRHLSALSGTRTMK